MKTLTLILALFVAGPALAQGNPDGAPGTLWVDLGAGQNSLDTERPQFEIGVGVVPAERVSLLFDVRFREELSRRETPEEKTVWDRDDFIEFSFRVRFYLRPGSRD